MVTKSSLAKKLASYSAIAAAVLAIDKKAEGQIVYTRLNPYDTVGYWTNTYQLDLNNDGIIDFGFNGGRETFTVHRSTYSSYKYNTDTFVGCKVYNSNKVLINTTGYFFTSNLIKPLNAGDIISSKDTAWVTGQQILAEHVSNNSFRSEQWAGQDHYAGLKLLKNGNTYYGWVRIYVAPHSEFALIEEYGYNSIPGSPVYAGQECEIEYPSPTIQQNDSILSTDATTKIQWYFNNELIPGDTLQSLTASQYGIYSVTTGDTTICHGTSLPFNYLNCSALPHPIITTSGNVICYYNEGPSLQLKDSVPNYYSIEWLLNDSIIQKQNGQPNYYAYLPGAYSVVIYESGGCSDTSNIINLVADSAIFQPVITERGDTLFSNYNKGNVWWIDDSTIATTNYILPVENQSYYLCVFDSLGCSFCSYPAFTYVNCNTFHPAISAQPMAFCTTWPPPTLTIDTVPYYYTVQWYLNDTSIANANGQYYNPVNIGNYAAIIEETGGCTDTTNTIYLNYDTLPPPIISQQGDSLISNYAAGNQWYQSNTYLQGDTQQVILPTSNGYYSATYSDSLGCTTDGSNSFYFFECSLFKESLVFLTPNDQCYPTQVEVGISYGLPPNGSLNWYMNDSSTGINYTYIYTNSTGYYYAEFFNSDSSCITYSDTVHIVSDNPAAFIRQSNDTLFWVRDPGFSIPIIYYQWYYYSTTVDNATKPYYIPTQDGNYYVEFTDSLGCNGITPQFEYTETGLHQIGSLSNINIYEYNNHLNIKFNNTPYSGYQLSVYNYLGQKVLSSEINSDGVIFDLTALAKGLYLVSVEKGNTRIVKKIVLD